MYITMFFLHFYNKKRLLRLLVCFPAQLIPSKRRFILEGKNLLLWELIPNENGVLNKTVELLEEQSEWYRVEVDPISEGLRQKMEVNRTSWKWFPIVKVAQHDTPETLLRWIIV